VLVGESSRRSSAGLSSATHLSKSRRACLSSAVPRAVLSDSIAKSEHGSAAATNATPCSLAANGRNLTWTASPYGSSGSGILGRQCAAVSIEPSKASTPMPVAPSVRWTMTIDCAARSRSELLTSIVSFRSYLLSRFAKLISTTESSDRPRGVSFQAFGTLASLPNQMNIACLSWPGGRTPLLRP